MKKIQEEKKQREEMRKIQEEELARRQLSHQNTQDYNEMILRYNQDSIQYKESFQDHLSTRNTRVFSQDTQLNHHARIQLLEFPMPSGH